METLKTVVFQSIVCESQDDIKKAYAKATAAGLRVKSGSGMIVPTDLRDKLGEILIGTFTGKADVRQTKKGDGVYTALPFEYDGKKFAILGDELQPKGTEFRFTIAKTYVLDENGNRIVDKATNEEKALFGFEYLGLVKVQPAPPIGDEVIR